MSDRSGGGIDYAALHYLLWCRRATPDTVRFHQATLAAELRITPSEVTRIVARLRHDGRLTKTSTRGVYRIVDPASWTPDLIGTNPRPVTR